MHFHGFEFVVITTDIPSKDIRSRLPPRFSFTTAPEVEVDVSTNEERTSSSFRAVHCRMVTLDALNDTRFRVSESSVSGDRGCTCSVGVDCVIVSSIRLVIPSEVNRALLVFILRAGKLNLFIAFLFFDTSRLGPFGFKDNGLGDAWASRELHAS